MSEEEAAADQVRRCQDSLVDIARKVRQRPDMAEGGVSRIFSASGFFESLGYKDIEILSQERLKREGKIPDFECIDDFEQSIFVLELKAPKDESLHPLESYRDSQLKDRYVVPRRSRYGVLSNGVRFYLYKRQDESLVDVLKIDDLSAITESEARTIYSALRKPSYEYTDFERILEELRRIEPKPLSDEENRETFYQIFRLKQEESGLATKFTKLVISLMNLFDELLKDEKSEFLDGAYRFWKLSYAHKPSKVPESWSRIKKVGKKPDEETLYKFMFCLETAHNIVSKLILAKVAEDAGFRNVSSLKKLEAYMNLKFGEGRINYIAYPFAVRETFDSLRSYLVSSLFEDDIFDWWQDCEIKVGRDVSEWRRRSNYAVESFGDSLARIFFALRSFDFSDVREDILGELYQHYFDPETRKALGEFYTPIEVVDYILDAVDYRGRKILGQRLLDPACGSGTFIVEALKRYLHALEDEINQLGREELWPSRLRDLCERPKIIGFDINPFARLMAEMRFMMEILPFYLRAQKVDPDFTLTTIPIFRTDSLEIETRTGKGQKQLFESEGRIHFSMLLPVISKEEGRGDVFFKIGFDIPVWDDLKKELRGDKDNYFLLLKTSFEAIKNHSQRGKWRIEREELKGEFSKRFGNADVLADVMLGYVNPILGQIHILRKQYSDGRLIKTLEDLVLAGILKNYFKYDYVVGNPPYVRTHRIAAKSTYEEIYPEIVFGQYDISYLFIGRGLQWFNTKNDESRLGYITSNKFCILDSGIKLREVILRNYQFNEFIDFSGIQTFAGALPSAAIIILQRRRGDQNTVKVDIKTQKDIPEELTKVTSFDALEEGLHYLLTNLHFYEVRQSRFNNNEELIFDFSLPEEFLPLISKIVNKSVKLSPDIVSDIKRGLRPDTGKFKDRFFIGLDEFSHLTADEKRLYKKHIRGEDIIGKYRVAWKGEYVKFEPEKMAEGGKKELYEQPKIVIKEIGKNLRASYDNEKYYCAKSIHLILEENSKADLKYLTALLNSQLLDFYFKSRFYLNRLGRGSFRYREQFLKQFPIKLPQTPAEQKLADEITSLVEQILSLAKTEQRVEGFPDPYFDELLDSGEIDEFDEIRWVPKRAYKDLEPQAAKEEWARVIVIGKNDVISSSKIYNDIREKYVIESLRGKNFSKDKEVIIRIPRSDSAIEKILSQLEADKKRLAQTPISELEDDINELVYELYGLDEEDKRVIEEFLARF